MRILFRGVAILVTAFVVASTMAQPAAAQTRNAPEFCDRCTEWVEPGVGGVHAFGGGGVVYACYPQLCHYDAWQGDCEWEHADCGWGAIDAVKKTLFAAKSGDPKLLRALVARHSQYVRYDTKKRTIDVASCEGTIVACIAIGAKEFVTEE